MHQIRTASNENYQLKHCGEGRERQVKNKYNRVRIASSSFLEAPWTNCMRFMRRWTATSSVTLLLDESCFCLCEFLEQVQLQMFLAWWWTYSFTVESRETRHTTIPLREEKKTSDQSQLWPCKWTIKHFKMFTLVPCGPIGPWGPGGPWTQERSRRL